VRLDGLFQNMQVCAYARRDGTRPCGACRCAQARRRLCNNSERSSRKLEEGGGGGGLTGEPKAMALPPGRKVSMRDMVVRSGGEGGRRTTKEQPRKMAATISDYGVSQNYCPRISASKLHFYNLFYCRLK